MDIAGQLEQRHCGAKRIACLETAVPGDHGGTSGLEFLDAVRLHDNRKAGVENYVTQKAQGHAIVFHAAARTEHHHIGQCRVSR